MRATQLYCEGTDQRGFIGLGDSATAHFRLPPQYFNASELNKNTFDHLLFLLENEADWPHRSWGTGHLNDTTGDCPGPLQSIYLQLLENVRSCGSIARSIDRELCELYARC